MPLTLQQRSSDGPQQDFQASHAGSITVPRSCLSYPVRGYFRWPSRGSFQAPDAPLAAIRSRSDGEHFHKSFRTLEVIRVGRAERELVASRRRGDHQV